MMASIRLKVGNWYKFNDRGREYIGAYTGTDNEFECCVCGKGHKAKCFNVYYDKQEDRYETWGYGASHMPEILEDLGDGDEIIVGE